MISFYPSSFRFIPPFLATHTHTPKEMMIPCQKLITTLFLPLHCIACLTTTTTTTTTATPSYASITRRAFGYNGRRHLKWVSFVWDVQHIHCKKACHALHITNPTEKRKKMWVQKSFFFLVPQKNCLNFFLFFIQTNCFNIISFLFLGWKKSILYSWQ